MQMSIFDKDPSLAAQPKPESFENQSHIINSSPIEIDLTQPNRAKIFSVEAITGFKESKLIAQIKTPTDDIGVIYTRLGELDPVLTIVGKDPEAIGFLHPGDECDLSDVGSKDKCILTIDDSGKHVYVYARDIDTAYQIFTRELEQYYAPEAPVDDHES